MEIVKINQKGIYYYYCGDLTWNTGNNKLSIPACQIMYENTTYNISAQELTVNNLDCVFYTDLGFVVLSPSQIESDDEYPVHWDFTQYEFYNLFGYAENDKFYYIYNSKEQ